MSRKMRDDVRSNFQPVFHRHDAIQAGRVSFDASTAVHSSITVELPKSNDFNTRAPMHWNEVTMKQMIGVQLH